MTKYKIKYTSQFKKDYDLAIKRNLNINLLDTIIFNISNGFMLDAKNNDHILNGEWKHHRECHVLPNWLLIYYINYEDSILILVRIGTHSDLFKM